MAKMKVVIDSELLEDLKVTLVKSGAVKRTEMSAEKIGKIIEALVSAEAE